MLLKNLVIILLSFTLVSCAAGMRGVHTGNIEVLANLIQELGPASEDTADEARRRKLYWVDLENALKGLAEYYPTEANQWRQTVNETLGENPYTQG